VEPDDVEPEEVEPDDVEPEEVEPDDVDPDDVEPDEVEPEDVEPEDVEPEDVEPDDVEPEEVEPDDVDPDDVDPEDVEPDDEPLAALPIALAVVVEPAFCASLFGVHAAIASNASTPICLRTISNPFSSVRRTVVFEQLPVGATAPSICNDGVIVRDCLGLGFRKWRRP